MTKIYVLKSIYTADESQEVVDLISLDRQKIKDELSVLLFNFLDAYTKATRFSCECFVGEIGVDVWENEEIIH